MNAKHTMTDIGSHRPSLNWYYSASRTARFPVEDDPPTLRANHALHPPKHGDSP
jgi:hypothetical protein